MSTGCAVHYSVGAVLVVKVVSYSAVVFAPQEREVAVAPALSQTRDTGGAAGSPLAPFFPAAIWGKKRETFVIIRPNV